MRIDLGTMRLAGTLRGPLVISLEAGEFLRLEAGEPVSVRCESGRLWITTENRGQTTISDDVWLRDGDSATLASAGPALIEAVDLTRLSIGRAAVM